MKKSLRWAVFLSAQVVITLLLLEGALRLLRPYHDGLRALLYLPSQRTAFDKIDSLKPLLEESMMGFIPYQYRRGFVLNSRSFRTPEYTGEKRPGVYRILCLGDSFTFASGGVPFQKMWHAQLESELNRSRHGPVEVFSLGVPGVGPGFELRLWELEQQLVRADLVILAFFIGNDFTDERDHGLEPWAATVPVRISYTWRLLRNLNRLWGERQNAHRWLLNAAEKEVHEKGGFVIPMKPHEIGPAQNDPDWYLKLEARRLRICVKAKRQEFLRISADVGEILHRLSAEVRASGARLSVMIIPDEYQVNPRLLKRVLDHLELGAQDIDLDFPQQRLKQLLEAAEIPYFDLLPTFRVRSRDQSLYWPNNSHWNIEGNILAGRLLAARLREGLPASEAPDAGAPAPPQMRNGE